MWQGLRFVPGACDVSLWLDGPGNAGPFALGA